VIIARASITGGLRERSEKGKGGGGYHLIWRSEEPKGDMGVKYQRVIKISGNKRGKVEGVCCWKISNGEITGPAVGERRSEKNEGWSVG
jgi:hypothetical protein